MLILLFRLFLITLATNCAALKFTYISTERPEVTYVNHKYVEYTNFTSKRYGRSDPFYYVSAAALIKIGFGNNITVDFYFYEFLSNRYKRSFVEMHYRVCDLVQNEMFLGIHLKQGAFEQPCPYPPGKYSLDNMTIPVKNVPRNFPFKKGRIEVNFTMTETHELIGSCHIDMELKEANIHHRSSP